MGGLVAREMEVEVDVYVKWKGKERGAGGCGFLCAKRIRGGILLQLFSRGSPKERKHNMIRQPKSAFQIIPNQTKTPDSPPTSQVLITISTFSPHPPPRTPPSLPHPAARRSPP